VPDALLGKKVRCKSCQQVFAASADPAPEGNGAAPHGAPARAAAGAPKSGPVRGNGRGDADRLDGVDEPRPKTAGASATSARIRPAGTGRGTDRPARRGAATSDKSKLWLIVGVAGGVILLGGIVAGAWWLGHRSGRQAVVAQGQPAAGAGPGQPQTGDSRPAEPPKTAQPGAGNPAAPGSPNPGNPMPVATPAGQPVSPNPSAGLTQPAAPGPVTAAPAGAPQPAGPAAPNPVAVAPAPAAESAGPAGPFALPELAGWAMAPDGKTLVVASGSSGQLVYLDTAAGKEGLHVEVNFQPACLAVQGDNLIAAAKGSGDLHVLDFKTGKERRAIKLGGTGFVGLACHPERGHVYAAAQDGWICAADVKAGTGWKTAGQGTMLAVDPAGGFVYAATQRPISHRLVVQQVGPQTQVRVRQTGLVASLAKYQVSGRELVLAGTSREGAINTRMIAVSADGKRLAVVGGGGIQGPDRRRMYAIPVYDTANLENRVGVIDTDAFPNNAAFHPVLNLGVAERSGGTLTVFKASSLAKVSTQQVPGAGASPGPTLLAFGGRGTKIIYGCTGGRGGPGARIYMMPLELTEQLRQALRAAKWPS
jgi:hypothetical protein